MTKIGRNQPCPCGSGKKYKKCCLQKEIPFSTLPPEVQQRALRIDAERLQLKHLGLRVNYVRPVMWQGKKVWALGSRVHFTRPNLTFHEFILGILSDTLGEEWWEHQRTLSPDEQHFLTRCFDDFVRWKKEAKSHKQTAPGIYAGDPAGYVHHLASVAFDVASLTHAQALPVELVNRLRHRDQYQGARYEIGIAAILSRLDFEVRFIGRETAGTRHPEFVATERSTKHQVAVEVKSKHRPGVINQAGELNEGEMRANVSRQLGEAMGQNPGGMPFMIFIDVNVPPTPGQELMDKPWVRDISEILGRKEPYTTDNPDPVSLLAITNFSQHYEGEQQASPSEHVITQSLHVDYPIPAVLLKDLSNALSTYGNVPHLDTDAPSLVE